MAKITIEINDKLPFARVIGTSKEKFDVPITAIDSIINRAIEGSSYRTREDWTNIPQGSTAFAKTSRGMLYKLDTKSYKTIVTHFTTPYEVTIPKLQHDIHVVNGEIISMKSFTVQASGERVPFTAPNFDTDGTMCFGTYNSKVGIDNNLTSSVMEIMTVPFSGDYFKKDSAQYFKLWSDKGYAAASKYALSE